MNVACARFGVVAAITCDVLANSLVIWALLALVEMVAAVRCGIYFDVEDGDL